MRSNNTPGTVHEKKTNSNNGKSTNSCGVVVGVHNVCAEEVTMYLRKIRVCAARQYYQVVPVTIVVVNARLLKISHKYFETGPATRHMYEKNKTHVCFGSF